ncbi:MAG: peptide chain release factor N(5)-glutamine methyltransferase [Thermoflexales bacterium]|nr:peptide chain release factor N(5)-glutamine methyltransferase [Thermoflexales bacterium]
MTLQQLCQQATEQLEAIDVDAPRLSAEVILAHALDITRTQLLTRLDQSPNPAELALFQVNLERVLKDEPLAYVVGHREFYDLDLITDRRALIPRPETECLIEFALERFTNHPAPRIADIGTGCGGIAVTLAKHLPRAHVIATDLSAEAVDLARENAVRHGVADRIDFRVGSLLEPVTETLDLLAANLPYIDDKDWPYLQKTIRGHEPKMAFLGGPDGLDLMRAMLKDAPRVVKAGGLILMEIGAYQGDDVTAIAQPHFPSAQITVRPDYAGLDRLVVIEVS